MKQITITTAAFVAIAMPTTAKSPILGLDHIELIQGWRQADGTHMTAVHIQLEKGWKTYWRVAGGGGVPPQFDWSGSENIARYEVRWPAPRVFHDYNQQTIGYKDALVLPVIFHPKDKNKPMNVQGTIDFGVCENVCVPVQSTLSAALPPRVASGKSIIKTALKNVARSGKSAGVKIEGCEFTPVKGGFSIQAKMTSSKGFEKHAVGIVEYPSGPEDWLQQKPSTAGYNTLTANAVLYAKGVAFIDRSKLRVTVLQNNKAIEINGCS